MANCGVCGTKAGMGIHLCGPCSAKSAAQSRDRDLQVAEQVSVEDGQRKAALAQEFLTDSRDKIRRTLASGSPVWLYKSSYVQVDAQMEQVSDPMGLQLRGLNESGWSGWEAIGVVPRTYAGSQAYVATSSMTMRDWGGQKTEQRVGLSGNIIGVYILLRMSVTSESLVLRGPEIDDVILQSAPS